MISDKHLQWLEGRGINAETAVRFAPFTADYLRSRLNYDPTTGSFTWKDCPTRTDGWRKRWAGRPAGCRKLAGRLFIMVDSRAFAASVLAWVIMTGDWPNHVVDHKDADPTNDRWSNLRAATQRQNVQNAKRSANNTSGIKGVSFTSARGLWRAAIKVDGKTLFLGHFQTKHEAGDAYASAAHQHFGEFARTE